MLAGAIHWAPYNIGYVWPAVPFAWLSWLYVRKRYLELWSKVRCYIPLLSSVILFFCPRYYTLNRTRITED